MSTKYRILIVDDEEDIRKIISRILSTKFEVVEAQDGLDALHRMRYCEPDMAVLDVMMPLMDGFQTCESIRKDPIYSNLPVLFLTALNTKSDIMQGYKSGANLYLTKPFDPERLMKNIEVHFETNGVEPRPKRYNLAQLQSLFDRVAGMKQAFDGKPDADREAAETTAYGRGFAGQPVAAKTVQAPALGGTEGPRPRLLVVDDEEDIQQILERGLTAHFEVVTASDGIEAIERIVKYEPDVVLIDAMMPRMSGFQLCQSLRRNRRFAETPIVFISAKREEKDIAYAMRLGANDFVGKPFDLGDLRSRLQKITAAPGFEVSTKRFSMEDLGKERESAERERKDRELLRQNKAAMRQEKAEESEYEKFLRQMKDTDI